MPERPRISQTATADVACTDPRAESAGVERDRRARQPQPRSDRVGTHPVLEESADLRCDRARVVGDPVGDRAVLLGGNFQQQRELVHLQERPTGLGHMDLHPATRGGVAVQVLVLHGLLEDRREQTHQLSQARRTQRKELAVAIVAQVRAGFLRFADLARLADLVRLERMTQLAVDLVQPVAAEEPIQVPERRPVALLGVLADRLLANLAGDLRLQPPLGVLAEHRHRASRVRVTRGIEDRDWRLPDADADLGEDVPQLGAGTRLVPAAAASAHAPVELVQHDPHPLALEPDAQVKSAAAVGQGMGMNRAGGRARHQSALLRRGCIRRSCPVASCRAPLPRTALRT